MLARTRELKGSGQLGDLVSREFAFLVTNLLFLGSAGAILLGTLWPTFTEAVRNVSATLTPENYNRFMGPLGLLLVLLLGLCPLIEWRKISAGRLLRNVWIQAAVGVVTAALLLLFGVREVWVVAAFAVVAFAATTIVLQWAAGIVARMKNGQGEPSRGDRPGDPHFRNRRRYGGQIIHLAILLIVAGIIGSQAYQDEVQVVLAKGEQTEVGGYTLLYKSYTYGQQEENGNKLRNAAVVEVYRNERRAGRHGAGTEPAQQRRRLGHRGRPAQQPERGPVPRPGQPRVRRAGRFPGDHHPDGDLAVDRGRAADRRHAGGGLACCPAPGYSDRAGRAGEHRPTGRQRHPAQGGKEVTGTVGVAIFFLLALLAAGAIVYPLLPGRAPARAGAGPSTDGEIEAAVRKLRRARAEGGRACPACGKAYQPGDRFCVRCGGALPPGDQSKSALPPAGPVCPSCGAALQEGDRFCAKCGYTLHDEEAA